MKEFSKFLKGVAVASAVALLAACGSTPQPVVKLSTNVVADENTRVGYVFVAPNGEATTHIFGASCLLCYGVASALTSSLDTHLKHNVDTSELIAMSDLVKSEYGSVFGIV